MEVCMEDEKILHHKELRVWRAAIGLAKDVYRHTHLLPAAEQYGLCSQLRRAVVSIPANIAEGAARGSSRDFARFVAIAQGSLAELETHLLLVQELYSVETTPSLSAQIVSIRRMLIRLRNTLIAKQ
jgi:four helix bundle protein